MAHSLATSQTVWLAVRIGGKKTLAKAEIFIDYQGRFKVAKIGMSLFSALEPVFIFSAI
jgi:hypothetical protein